MITRLLGSKATTRLGRNFSLLKEWQQRSDMKMASGTHSINEAPTFYNTPTRPGNFGEHIDFKINVDNWFEENRAFNEHQTDVRRTHVYILNAMLYGGLISYGRLFAVAIIGRLNGWTRYDRDTYAEFDVGELPPGEILQVVWNGRPVFIRRLTKEEVAHEQAVEKNRLPDPGSEVNLIANNQTHLLVCSAVCTHLGCIPIPHMGAYAGWVCICHGSVFDKFARIRQGPAPMNLPNINCSLDGDLVLMEEIKYSREPSVRFWA